ncbi:hypothetical protein B0H19DRAFT_546596 [Mycena capillaripes]|nr:hypothetical protein B0H19DRAFT_546596 [Mycena capillaripes]
MTSEHGKVAVTAHRPVKFQDNLNEIFVASEQGPNEAKKVRTIRTRSERLYRFCLSPSLLTTRMADRTRRPNSDAHPGDIVNNAKQKRRTPAEMQRDKLLEQQKKAQKQQETAAKKKSGVKQVAAMEEKIRAQDERDRASTARPDLLTAQLKRPVVAQTQQEAASETPHDNPSPIHGPSSSTDHDIFMPDAPGVNDGDPLMDDGDNSDRDPNYDLPAGEATASEDEDDADQEDAEDDVEIKAKVAAYKRSLQKSKPKAARRV